jgi:thiamine-monophosphate kinase
MRDHLLDRYLLPQPRTAVTDLVREYASAAMDVSDGLAGDLDRLCGASGVSAEVETAQVPLSDAARAALKAEPALIETILAGGDDYEIICTLPAADCERFCAACAEAGVPATAIGTTMAGEGGARFLDADKRPLVLAKTSFSHF